MNCSNCGFKTDKKVVICPRCGTQTKNINSKKQNKFIMFLKWILNMYIWILFLPIKLIELIKKSDRFANTNKILKFLIIVCVAIVCILFLIIYIGLFKENPQSLFNAIMLLLIYLYIKKRSSEKNELIRIKDEENRKKYDQKNKIVNAVLDIIFNKQEMKTRLKEFILQNTKKYDNAQISRDEYFSKIDMFIEYINKIIELEINSKNNKYTKEIIDYRDNIGPITVDGDIIVKFIENKKTKIYIDEIKNIINIDDYKELGDVAKEYIDIYGENGLNKLNIKILSDALDESYEDVDKMVTDEYKRVKNEYEMRKLEGQLFESNSTFKDMEYIDSLSGFEFEDYLEELFKEFGYEVRELPYTNDYGADLIIKKGPNEIVIQAKNYSSNVGNKAVQEVIAAKSYYNCDIGMVITNSFYTNNAKNAAEVSGIILIDRYDLQRIINKGSIYFNSLVS